MGPVKQLVPIAFSGGLDTKTDPKQVLPGKLLDLQNGIFQQTGGLNRRWGYKALGNGVIGSPAAITSCKAIDGGYNSELLLYDGKQGYSYIPANNAWASRGSIVSLIQANQTIVRNSSQQLSPDSATLSGIEVYAWEDSRGGIRYSVVDQASSTLVLVDQPLYAGMASTLVRPKCIPVPSLGIVAIFYVTADGSIGYVGVIATNPTTATVPHIVLSSLAASGPGFGVWYDAAYSSDFGQVYLAIQLPFGSFTITPLAAVLRPVAGVLAVSKVQQPLATPFPATLGGVTIVVDSSFNVWFIVSLILSGNTYVIAIGFSTGLTAAITGAQTLVTLAGAIQIPAITATVIGNTVTVFAEQRAATSFNELIYVQIWNVGVGNVYPTNQVFARSVGLASKAFVYLGATYVNVAFQSQQQSTYFTMDSAGRVVSKVNAGLGGGLVSSSDYVLPECQQVSPGIFIYANLVKGIVNTEAGGVLSLLGVNATSLDFIDSNHFLSSAINGCMYTVGGILQSYDGAQYVEHGFHVYPEAIVATPSNAGGSMAANTYNYAVTYEWPDNNGNVQISTPSLVYTATVASGATGSVQHTIPTLRLTKKARVRIVVYRSTGGTPGGGTLLYRVTSAAVPLYNDPTVDSISFTDTLADASITSNGLMYTQPLVVGSNPILPNSAPPACSLIATFANRIFLAGLDDQFSLWYSQAAVPGIPMQFSAQLLLRSDPDGGPITAIARMDDKLVIFKKTSIFYLTGNGPTATGDQNDFGVPIAVPSGDVGCQSQNSIVLTPMGLLFQSLNGIYLLDRGLNVSYKGAPVEAFNALAITSATLIPNQWVVFTTTTDKAIVYDYYYDQWATFTNHTATDSDLYLGGNNALVYANPNGTVYQQTPTVFTDAGKPIPFRALTAKINPGQIQGYQRVYHAFLLGQYKGSHTLSVACLFDYDDTPIAMALIPADATLGTGTTFGSASPFGVDSPFGGVSSGQTVYQFRLDVLRQCQSIQFDITDSQTGAGNEGFSLTALSLLVGVKQGGNKMPAVKQFGVT